MADKRSVSSLLIHVEMLSGGGLRHSSSSMLEVWWVQSELEEAAVRLKSLKAHLCLGGGQGSH